MAGELEPGHQQLADACARPRGRPLFGIGEELVRLSVGIETADDITDDLDQALRASQRT